MNRHYAPLLLAMGLATLSAQAQKKFVPCTIKFSLATEDELGNVDLGLSPDDKKFFEKKIFKTYPELCYAEQKPNEGIWFYLAISTATREGATTATTQTHPNGDGTTTSNTRVRPHTISTTVYTLKIGRFENGKLNLLRTFQRSQGDGGLFSSTYGDAEHDVILEAVDWLTANNPGSAKP